MLMKSKEFIGPLKSIKLDEQVPSYVTAARCFGFKIHQIENVLGIKTLLNRLKNHRNM